MDVRVHSWPGPTVDVRVHSWPGPTVDVRTHSWPATARPTVDARPTTVGPGHPQSAWVASWPRTATVPCSVHVGTLVRIVIIATIQGPGETLYF